MNRAAFRFGSDADFNGNIVRGVCRRLPQLDIVRVHDFGLRTADDPEILEWAAAEGRILLTHDAETMIDFANKRIANGLAMPGLFVFRQNCPIGVAIAEIELVVACSSMAYWNLQVTHMPL